jgi:hypothetical protein
MADSVRLDDRERRIVEIVFKVGLVLSTGLMTAGLLLGFASGHAASSAVDLTHLGDMSTPGALMAVGIGILGATPAANILALIFLWVRHRQLRLIAVALSIVLILVAAVVLGQE